MIALAMAPGVQGRQLTITPFVFFSCLTARCLFDLQCACVCTCILIYNLGSITLAESQITYLSILTNIGLIYTLDPQMKGFPSGKCLLLQFYKTRSFL